MKAGYKIVESRIPAANLCSRGDLAEGRPLEGKENLSLPPGRDRERRGGNKRKESSSGTARHTDGGGRRRVRGFRNGSAGVSWPRVYQRVANGTGRSLIGPPSPRVAPARSPARSQPRHANASARISRVAGASEPRQKRNRSLLIGNQPGNQLVMPDSGPVRASAVSDDSESPSNAIRRSCAVIESMPADLRLTNTTHPRACAGSPLDVNPVGGAIREDNT